MMKSGSPTPKTPTLNLKTKKANIRPWPPGSLRSEWKGTEALQGGDPVISMPPDRMGGGLRRTGGQLYPQDYRGILRGPASVSDALKLRCIAEPELKESVWPPRRRRRRRRPRRSCVRRSKAKPRREWKVKWMITKAEESGRRSKGALQWLR